MSNTDNIKRLKSADLRKDGHYYMEEEHTGIMKDALGNEQILQYIETEDNAMIFHKWKVDLNIKPTGEKFTIDVINQEEIDAQPHHVPRRRFVDAVDVLPLMRVAPIFVESINGGQRSKQKTKRKSRRRRVSRTSR